MSVFPLKSILENKSARCLQEISGVDTNNPKVRKSYFDAFLNKSVSRISSKSGHSVNVEEQYPEKKNKLIHCLTTIVEDAVDQMHILSLGRKSDQCLRKFRKTLEERIANMLYEDPIYDMETGDPYDVAFTKRKLIKNLEDCAVCREFLTIIKNELKAEKKYTSVIDIMNTIIDKKQAEANLLEDEVNNYTKMKDYKHMLITHSRDYQIQMQKVNEMLASSEDRTQELLFGNLLRIRYIKTWENARQEQNSLSCRKSEKELEDIISKYQLEIEKEIRIHNEIETYILENLTDLESEIKYWVSRYDKEMESRNIQIQIMRDRKEDQEKAFQELKNLYNLHKKEIEDFLKYKDRKRIEDELKELQIRCAIKIQAWWRGNMVRHQLGPFNPKKKGKKGKDKNKKKK